MIEIIDLRSDTVTKPSLLMREAMMQAEVGDDVYGEDPSVNLLQKKMAELTGKEATLFVTSGTFGNQLCVKTHTDPGDEIIVEYSAHIFQYETAGASFISRAQIYPIQGKYGVMKLQDIEDAIRPDIYYFPKTKLICLENTHNRAGGTVLDIKYISDVNILAKSKGISLHLDGARLWNASIATGISIKDYAQYFDSLSICFSKGMGSPVGSVICGSHDFIQRARKYRKIFGGGMRQVGILASACLYAIDNNFKLIEYDHKRAKQIAECLQKIPSVNIDMDSVQTNIVIFGFNDPKVVTSEVIAKLKQDGLLVSVGTKGKIRMVTHLDINDDDIEKVKHILKKNINF